jgi:hypothetical protein
MNMDALLDLFFSFLGGPSSWPAMLSFGVVGALVLTLVSRFTNYRDP